MIAWIIVGLLIYFGHGYRNSALRSRRPDVSELHLTYAFWPTPLVEAGIGGEHRLLIGLRSTHKNCNDDSALSSIHEYAAAVQRKQMRHWSLMRMHALLKSTRALGRFGASTAGIRG